MGLRSIKESNSSHCVMLVIYKNMAQNSTNSLDSAWSLTALASPVWIIWFSNYFLEKTLMFMVKTEEKHWKPQVNSVLEIKH